eukprot:CAMPEP_0205806886 /NCGR_PEP_ID=MMETSP0205-20121125/10534_1 /ASSEMBLY_ACC=CAM_ASM_000278 /TAXON_ID=36767 /ORGANISM="Euplotes focardii, Strain TN1" /LENGTH=151 /DNA_ID=CAMNT_0053080401 /DNA_START=126 /DNA_END=581 /DNA_ORIENTATION=+
MPKTNYALMKLIQLSKTDIKVEGLEIDEIDEKMLLEGTEELNLQRVTSNEVIYSQWSKIDNKIKEMQEAAVESEAKAANDGDWKDQIIPTKPKKEDEKKKQREELKEIEKIRGEKTKSFKKYSFSKNSIFFKYLVSQNSTSFLWILRKFYG